MNEKIFCIVVTTFYTTGYRNKVKAKAEYIGNDGMCLTRAEAWAWLKAMNVTEQMCLIRKQRVTVMQRPDSEMFEYDPGLKWWKAVYTVGAQVHKTLTQEQES